jgi:hypothetical protein
VQEDEIIIFNSRYTSKSQRRTHPVSAYRLDAREYALYEEEVNVCMCTNEKEYDYG